jgi:hypothetical protein
VLSVSYPGLAIAYEKNRPPDAVGPVTIATEVEAPVTARSAFHWLTESQGTRTIRAPLRLRAGSLCRFDSSGTIPSRLGSIGAQDPSFERRVACRRSEYFRAGNLFQSCGAANPSAIVPRLPRSYRRLRLQTTSGTRPKSSSREPNPGTSRPSHLEPAHLDSPCRGTSLAGAPRSSAHRPHLLLARGSLAEYASPQYKRATG